MGRCYEEQEMKSCPAMPAKGRRGPSLRSGWQGVLGVTQGMRRGVSAPLLVGPAVPADEGDEDAAADGLFGDLSLAFGDDGEGLAPAVAEGEDEAAAVLELVEPGLGHVGGAGGDQDAIIRGLVRVALGAVPDQHLHVGVAQLLEHRASPFRQSREYLPT